MGRLKFKNVVVLCGSPAFVPPWCFQLADVYGNVFSVRLGSGKMVFVAGYKMVKEALVTQAENFVDRPYSPTADRFYSGTSGIKKSLFLLSHAVQKWVPASH